MIDTKFTDQSDFSSPNNLCFIRFIGGELTIVIPHFPKIAHAPYELLGNSDLYFCFQL